MQKITLGLGEKTTLSLKDGIGKDAKLKEVFKDGPGRWGSTGSPVIVCSEDLEGETIEIVGSSIGKAVVFNRRDVDMTTDRAIASKMAGADFMRQLEDQHAVSFEVEVVATKPEPGTPPPSPLATSQQFDGLLPVNEMQDGPSEATPYGMDQDNKPIAPHPGMVGPDTSSVARASENAEVKSPAEKAAEASGQAAPKRASSKSGKKTSRKKAGKKGSAAAGSATKTTAEAAAATGSKSAEG